MSEANATCNIPPGFGVPASPLWPAMAKRLGRVVRPISAIVPATNVLRFIGSSLLSANAAVHVHPGASCLIKKAHLDSSPGRSSNGALYCNVCYQSVNVVLAWARSDHGADTSAGVWTL